MNYLGIDFGTKNIGTAICISGVIKPYAVYPNNNQILEKLKEIIVEYKIHKIYIGLSEGNMRNKIHLFIKKLQNLSLPIETVEEQVSTIDATKIYKSQGHPRKDYKKTIDSLSAAVILQRVIL